MAKQSYTETVQEIRQLLYEVRGSVYILEQQIKELKDKQKSLTLAQHEMYTESLRAMSTATKALATRLR